MEMCVCVCVLCLSATPRDIIIINCLGKDISFILWPRVGDWSSIYMGARSQALSFSVSCAHSRVCVHVRWSVFGNVLTVKCVIFVHCCWHFCAYYTWVWEARITSILNFIYSSSQYSSQLFFRLVSRSTLQHFTLPHSSPIQILPRAFSCIYFIRSVLFLPFCLILALAKCTRLLVQLHCSRLAECDRLFPLRILIHSHAVCILLSVKFIIVSRRFLSFVSISLIWSY